MVCSGSGFLIPSLLGMFSKLSLVTCSLSPWLLSSLCLLDDTAFLATRSSFHQVSTGKMLGVPGTASEYLSVAKGIYAITSY